VNTWKVILATMVIFGAGVVTGALVVRYTGRTATGHAPHAWAARQAQSGSLSGMRLEFLRRLSAELDLTPDQREHVDKLIKDSQDRSRKIMEPVAPALRAELQQTKEAFRDQLTPDQRARFDEILKRQHAREPRRTPPKERHSETNSP
jgi:hypothetical protein